MAQGYGKFLSVVATKDTAATGSNAAASHAAKAISDPEMCAPGTPFDSSGVSMKTDL